MIGTILYCELPSRFQGKPPKMRACTISNATQSAAPDNVQMMRAVHGTEINCAARFSIVLAGPFPSNFAGKNFQHNQTQVAMPRARKALNATHPRMGNQAT